MKIVQVANFVAPQSGGIKTALAALRRGYCAAGHQAVLVAPGPEDDDVQTAAGRVLTLRAPRLPKSGGYRVLVDLGAVRATLTQLRPDRLEVSDRLTLTGLGPWARGQGIPSLNIAHERLDALLTLRLHSAALAVRGADRWNRRLAEGFDGVVCTSAWAADEFARVGVEAIRVPLGVDLELFTPAKRDLRLRRRLAPDDHALLVHCGRLSDEKRPDLAIEAVRALRRKGGRATLAIAGDGPLRPVLERRAEGLGVRFLGHLADRDALAALLATADVAVQPGPSETFGLAALEALAAGTQVVVARSGAAAELTAPAAGTACFSHPAAIAAAVRDILAVPEETRRSSARARAEQFPWSATVAGLLAAHGVDSRTQPARPQVLRPVS